MSRLHSRGYRSVSERFPEPGATAHPAAAANPIEETRRKAVEDLGSDHACATRGALNLLIAVVLLTITPETPGAPWSGSRPTRRPATPDTGLDLVLTITIIRSGPVGPGPQRTHHCPSRRTGEFEGEYS